MDAEPEEKKHGTRIFKKSTPNGKLTVYLGKRDFIDHLSHVDPIEGVVLVDPEYVKNRKVFVTLQGSFRYGRSDLDIIIGFTFVKDLYSSTIEIYPDNSNLRSIAETSHDNAHKSFPDVTTKLQSRLIRKLVLKLPTHSPASVTLVVNSLEGLKPCRVDYDLRVFVADSKDAQPQKRNSVRMAIRKLTYAPSVEGPQPTADIQKDFIGSLGSLRVEATLDKQKYYHGEDITVNLIVDNNSSKTIKKVRISVRQYVNLCVHNAGNYKCTVAELVSDEDFPINPSRTGWCKAYRLKPLLSNNRDKYGLALDGDLKHEDTNLASSTIQPDNGTAELVGITVSYKVKVRLYLGFTLSDVCLQLPFILTHPNPGDREADDAISNGDIEEFDITGPYRDTGSDNEINETMPLPAIVNKSNTHPIQNSSYFDQLKDLFQEENIKSTNNYPSILDTTSNITISTNSNELIDCVPKTAISTNPFISSEPVKLNLNNNIYNNNPFSQRMVWDQLTVSHMAKPEPKNLNEDDLVFAEFARLRMQATPAISKP